MLAEGGVSSMRMTDSSWTLLTTCGVEWVAKMFLVEVVSFVFPLSLPEVLLSTDFGLLPVLHVEFLDDL